MSGLDGVRRIVLVLSGKGGVGKSTVSAELALALAAAGCRVGLLDIDLTGPSQPQMLGVAGKQVHQSSAGWVPVYTDDTKRLGVMSLGFLLPNKDDAVIWRGPKKTAMIKQFVADVAWGELDYLLIDTPPGTSDEHIAIAEQLKTHPPEGAVIVTTPQAVSLADVRKELSFCRKVGIPILGVIENMSGFVCPHCEECTELFSTGGGERLAAEQSLAFLGRVPIDPNLTTLMETACFAEQFKQSPLAGVTTMMLARFLLLALAALPALAQGNDPAADGAVTTTTRRATRATSSADAAAATTTTTRETTTTRRAAASATTTTRAPANAGRAGASSANNNQASLGDAPSGSTGAQTTDPAASPGQQAAKQTVGVGMIAGIACGVVVLLVGGAFVNNRLQARRKSHDLRTRKVDLLPLAEPLPAKPISDDSCGAQRPQQPQAYAHEYAIRMDAPIPAAMAAPPAAAAGGGLAPAAHVSPAPRHGSLPRRGSLPRTGSAGSIRSVASRSAADAAAAASVAAPARSGSMRSVASSGSMRSVASSGSVRESPVRESPVRGSSVRESPVRGSSVRSQSTRTPPSRAGTQ
ncbi:cytosolic Fe-S cluster assembly factor cfd1 [Polyrhizophydium stewartii]|uniref:Cytosolic Fe-S cluster assembly factor cfd1 n=1 Tax=Polyrhizophydium stewartii TaxID=2732419 RepID=A0ABR4NA71_9FUNG